MDLVLPDNTLVALIKKNVPIAFPREKPNYIPEISYS